jgi:hypothetical protein
MSKEYLIVTIEYSGPEKTTGPSGVIPIAVLKEESKVDFTILLLAFIIGNLFLISLHYQLIKNYDIFYLLLFNFYY